MDQNTSMKEFVTIIDKQIGKLKTTDSKGTKPPTKSPSLVKKGAASTKPKTPKQQKESMTQLDDKQNSVTPKRNSSDRSLLEGNPEKKQKESTRKLEIEEIKDLSLNTNVKQDDTIRIETESLPSQKLKGNLQTLGMETEQQMALQALLHELKDIKHTILNLDTKIDKELVSRSVEYREINDSIKTQKSDRLIGKGE